MRTYEQIPLQECENCLYRISRLVDEEISETMPRLLPPILVERSCEKSYCVIDKPGKKNEPKGSLIISLINTEGVRLKWIQKQ